MEGDNGESSLAQDSPLVVIFVRHGKTSSTGKILPGRSKGLHLDAIGKKSAHDLAFHIKNRCQIAAIYSSPLERTQETAAPSAEALSLPVILDDRLSECDFGDWTGARLADLRKLPEWDSLISSPDDFRFPGGESFVETEERIRSFTSEMVNTYKGQIILAFTHADPIRIALSSSFGMGVSMMHKITVSPTSITTVLYQTEASMVLTVNSQLNILDMQDLVMIGEQIDKNN